MKKISFVAVSACLTVMFGGSVHGAVPGVPGSLIVVSEVGLQKNGGMQYLFNTGKVNLHSSYKIEHQFLLHNTSKDPVVLERLEASCGCTSAVLLGQESSELPYTLAPGKEVKIKVSINGNQLMPGSFIKSISVYVHGQPNPEAVLELSGDLQGSISVSPSNLDFGKIPSGTERSLSVTVTSDPGLLSSGQELRVLSGSQSVIVTPDVVPPSSSPTPAAPIAPTIRTYKVTVAPNAFAGPITGSLMFLRPTTGEEGQGGYPLATVPVSGEVVGDITALPNTISFGAVTAGKPAVLTATLTGSTDKAFDNVTVSSAYRYVSVRLMPNSKSEKPLSPTEGNQRQLEVTVSPDMPPGGLETQIILTSPDGHELIIPVSVWVTKANLSH